MEDKKRSKHLKQALKNEDSIEIFIWKMLADHRKRTKARYYSNCTQRLTVSPTYVYNQSGFKKTQIIINAITQFREKLTETTFEKALEELENEGIIYQEDNIWHDNEDFDLPTFEE